MRVTLIAVGMRTKVMYCFSCYLALYSKSICNIALILLQNKALGLWNSLMQKSGFPKMHHYVGFWQIGSHMRYLKLCEDRLGDTHPVLLCARFLTHETTKCNNLKM